MKSKKTDMKLPAQLIGVHEDALRINATHFAIDKFASIVMASCSNQNEAIEIDFEMAAGQEMIDYIVAQSELRKGRGKFQLEYEGKRFNCTVTSDGRRKPKWVQMSWKSQETKRIAEQGAGEVRLTRGG